MDANLTKMMNQFNATNAVAEQSTNAGSKFQQSESTGVLHINMNNHAYQGNIIFIPVLDKDMNPFFCSIAAEVTAVFKMQDGTPGQGVRRLLEKQWYTGMNDEESARYDALLAEFNSVYGNREMLDATDWRDYIGKRKYFGFYGWVINHTNNAGAVIKDKDGIPHNGVSGEGRLAFIQFKSTAFSAAWDNLMKQQAAMRIAPEQWVPQLFGYGNPEFRTSALNIAYSQDDNKKFAASVSISYFQNQLQGFVNNAAVNPQAYHLTADKYDAVTNIAKEFINTNIEGSLFNDAHVAFFESALKAISRSFDYYQKYGADAYQTYSNNYGYNEVNQSAAASMLTAAPAQTGASVSIDQLLQLLRVLRLIQ